VYAHLHNLILELGQEEVNNLVLLDGQGVQVDLLHALDLASLHQTAELGDGLPLLLLGLATTTSTATATSTSTVTTATTVAETTATSTTTVSHDCLFSGFWGKERIVVECFGVVEDVSKALLQGGWSAELVASRIFLSFSGEPGQEVSKFC
jgi:hypothetical protein